MRINHNSMALNASDHFATVNKKIAPRGVLFFFDFITLPSCARRSARRRYPRTCRAFSACS